MSVLIATQLHSGNLATREPDETVHHDWSHPVRSAFKIDASSLAHYCDDNAQFWSNYSRWLPLTLREDAWFWVEYDPTPEMAAAHGHTEDLLSVGYLVHVSDDNTRPVLDVSFFTLIQDGKRPVLKHLAHDAQVQLDDQFKVEDVTYDPPVEGFEQAHFLSRELFFALMPLTVVSDPSKHEMFLMTRHARARVNNLHSRDKKKRHAAVAKAKMKYWSLEFGKPITDGDTIDPTALAKEQN